MFIITRLDAFPRLALIILLPILIILLTLPRLIYRIVKDGSFKNIIDQIDKKLVQIIVIGAGNDANRFIREVNRKGASPYNVIGIIDNNPSLVGRNIRGVRVLGNISRIDNIIEKLNKDKFKPQKLIIGTNKLKPDEINFILSKSESLGFTVAKLPNINELKTANRQNNQQLFTSQFNIKSIEMEDLLKRPQQVLDLNITKKMIQNKNILVTGAGGTIGSEIIRQIIYFEPRSICLLDNSEYALYTIQLELNQKKFKTNILPIIKDIKSFDCMNQVFSDFNPDIVFHAAALKHVPLSETNKCETFLTNVIGTQNVAKCSSLHMCEKMVLISTDKAVYPSSFMGVTKKLAEGYCQALSVEKRKSRKMQTKFLVVRFGNVLGSTGSVVPLFQKQILSGGPVTVTHPEATRYFMTKHEAVQLVLQASSIPEDKNHPERIFVLDMGDPIKIQDLARQLIRMEGFIPDKEIKIVFTGLRPGEKVHETLFQDNETLVNTQIENIKQASPLPLTLELLENKLSALEILAKEGQSNKVLDIIKDIIPEYKYN